MITTPITADLIRGAVELETADQGLLPHQLPRHARQRGATEELGWTETQPSGYGSRSAPRPP